jgi:hypothetical protein
VEPQTLSDLAPRPAVDVLVLLDSRDEPAAGLEPGTVAALLGDRCPAATWRVRTETPDRPPAPEHAHRVAELMAEARGHLLAADADVVVLVTDRRVVLHGRRVRSHASPVQQAAVLSTATQPRRASHGTVAELEGMVVDLVVDLLDLEGDERGAPASPRRRLGRGARQVVGRVVASRPWLMTVHLSRTLVGASAAAFLAVVTPDFWVLADRLSLVRLGLISTLVLLAGVLVLVVGGGLRERPTPGTSRHSVRLHNTAVWLSVGLGVLSLFAVLVLANLAITLLVLPDSLVAGAVGHSVGWPTMTRIGVVTAIVSLVGSVFGAGLEEDEDVQDATFGGSDDVRFAEDLQPAVSPGPARR